MGKFTAYVLYSLNYDKIYIGQTNNLQRRLEEHYSGLSNYSSAYLPWEVIYTEEFETRSLSMRREKELKSHNGRTFIRGIINEKILTK